MTTVKHPLFARIYASLVVPGITRMGGDAFRERLLRGLSGTVLEVGAGEGSNFPHYPDAVTRVVAVEPEAYLRHRARERGSSHPRVEVVDGTAEALPVSEAAVDAVVFCLVLCSVEDQRRALREARRVLRPGGQIRLLEHVRAHEEGRMRGVQRALDATVVAAGVRRVPPLPRHRRGGGGRGLHLHRAGPLPLP